MLIIINSVFAISILILAAYVCLAINSIKWKYVAGKVLSFYIQKHSHPNKRIGAPMFEIACAPSIKYEYVVSGKRYVGTRIRFSAINKEYIDEKTMYEELGFTDTDSVDVYYFKYIPSISVIKPNDSEIAIYITLIMFIIAGMSAVNYFYYNAL